jgi:hypothetical protein
MVIVVIRYDTKTAAVWTSLFIVRPFIDDTITIAVWAGFHMCSPRNDQRRMHRSLILRHVDFTPRYWTFGGTTGMSSIGGDLI